MGDGDGQQQQRSGGIDVLRAVAALGVVADHCVNFEGTGLGWIDPYLARLPIMVPVFFTLSGYLLYRPFAAARLAGGKVSVRPYLTRRFFRIFPGYWFALSVLAIYPGLYGVTQRPLVYYAMLYQYAPTTAHQACVTSCGLPPGWSLSVEATFYIALPIMAWCIARLLRGREAVAAHIGILVVSGGVSILLSVLSFQQPGDGPFSAAIASTILGTWVWFVPGMVIAVLDVSRRREPASAVRFLKPILDGLSRPIVAYPAAAGVFLLLGAPVTDGLASTPVLAEIVVLTLQAVFAGLLLMPAVLGPRPLAVGRRWAPARFLGRVSFGIYLWHWGVLYALVRNGAWNWSVHPKIDVVLLFLAAVVITTALATVSWYLVERPCIALSRRMWRAGSMSRGTRLRLAGVVAAATAAIALAVSAGGDPSFATAADQPAGWNLRFDYSTVVVLNPHAPTGPNRVELLMGDLGISVTRRRFTGLPSRELSAMARGQVEGFHHYPQAAALVWSRFQHTSNGIAEQGYRWNAYVLPGSSGHPLNVAVRFVLGHWLYVIDCTSSGLDGAYFEQSCQQVWSSVRRSSDHRPEGSLNAATAAEISGGGLRPRTSASAAARAAA